MSIIIISQQDNKNLVEDAFFVAIYGYTYPPGFIHLSLQDNMRSMENPSQDQSIIRAAGEIIIRDFEIERSIDGEQWDEEKLFEILADQVAYMIEFRLEHLFSLLYRMDVKEELVRAALAPDAPDPANIGIARLVLERQKQRNYTKATIKPEELGEDWDW